MHQFQLTGYQTVWYPVGLVPVSLVSSRTGYPNGSVPSLTSHPNRLVPSSPVMTGTGAYLIQSGPIEIIFNPFTKNLLNKKVRYGVT